MTKNRAKKLRPGEQVEQPRNLKQNAPPRRGLITSRTETTFTVRWEDNVKYPARFEIAQPAHYRNMALIAKAK